MNNREKLLHAYGILVGVAWMKNKESDVPRDDLNEMITDMVIHVATSMKLTQEEFNDITKDFKEFQEIYYLVVDVFEKRTREIQEKIDETRSK